jgi:hypothetical protein
VFHQTGKFYSKRSKLYEEGLELLLEQWDKSREIERDEIYRDLSVERKLELLSYLAVKKFEQPQYVLFEQTEIENYISEFLGIERQESQAVLKAIESQHGLLIERAQKVWSFSHLTFHEYFAAREIVLASRTSVGEDREPPLQELVEHITEPRWREIFLLTAGMLPNANDLLRSMKAQIDELLEDEKLQQFLKWIAEKARSIKVQYKLGAFRAIYFAFALDHDAVSIQDRDQRRALSRYFANIPPPQPHEYINSLSYVHHPALALNVVLQRVYVPRSRPLADSVDSELRGYLQQLSDQVSNQFSREAFEPWWQEHGETWIEQVQALKIWSVYGEQLSPEQKELLEQYYDANLLLMNCLNSARYVSRVVREEIEETLLLPIAEIEKRKLEKAE